MKSVNNAIIEDSDAIYMAQLNGHGGIMPITANSIASNERPFGFISIIVNPKVISGLIRLSYFLLSQKMCF